jgi:hydroxymethylpyrimidine pyrophosphatase-like HAD family hydrolase
MIEAAGLGVAMANAVPELKEIADYVTLSNNEDGVKHVLERFVLQQEPRG